MEPATVLPSQSQIAAAQLLYTQLEMWKTTDDALDAIAVRFPDFDGLSVLVKASAVNALYHANVYAIHHMASHIVEVISQTPPKHWCVDEVEKIACLCIRKKTWHFRSFASKFAHFFMDRERFPIYDWYALGAIDHYLSTRHSHAATPIPYATYVAEISRLKDLAGLAVGTRELDRFLWVVGQYLHRCQPTANTELKEVFCNERPELTPLVHQIVGVRA